ncbi:flagellar hook-length control protein FliK [Neobacillus sp. 114]|uniref:flagellar hook-length control protein FliK n=1 Tax=Neobacillus sp. 114 TaxID=3048535 RepID=UPI0024C280CE|nr:flagellar hook-length control protein FliK [Neobacillus sp. 114]
MIQLNVLNPKGVNNASKPSAKGTEESSAFIDLLKQISGVEVEKEKKDEQLSSVFNFITLPLEQPPLETAPIVTELPNTDESAIKLQNRLQGNPELSIATAPDSQNTVLTLKDNEKRLANHVEPMAGSVPVEIEHSITAKVVPIVQEGEKLTPIKEETSLEPDLQETSQELPGELDHFGKSLFNMLNEKEQPQMPSFQSVNSGTSLNPSPNMMGPIGKGTFEMPVRASHLANDVTKVLSAAIDVQKVNDNLEAAFSLKPEHLGKVDVKVSIHDGNVTAEFFTSTTLGKDLLETQVQVLRSALEQQGFQVNKIDISQQTMNFAGPFSQKGDSHARHGQQESKKRNGEAGYNKEEEYRDYATESISVSQINTTA